MRCFDLTIVHGLLQTEDYMRGVCWPGGWLHHSDDEIDRLVALRHAQAGGAAATAEPRPLDVVAVLDEVGAPAAGRRPGVMAGQLDRLLEAIAATQRDHRVLPLGAGLLRAHAGQFVLLDIPDELGSDVVYVEGQAGDAYLDAAVRSRALPRGLRRTSLDRALSPTRAPTMIARYRARHASAS